MKLKMILGSVLFIFSVIGLAQHSGSDDSDGADDFDLNVLISRVSQSRALGFLTKLSLKRDVDRLLEIESEFPRKAEWLWKSSRSANSRFKEGGTSTMATSWRVEKSRRSDHPAWKALHPARLPFVL